MVIITFGSRSAGYPRLSVVCDNFAFAMGANLAKFIYNSVVVLEVCSCYSCHDIVEILE